MLVRTTSLCTVPVSSAECDLVHATKLFCRNRVRSQICTAVLVVIFWRSTFSRCAFLRRSFCVGQNACYNHTSKVLHAKHARALSSTNFMDPADFSQWAGIVRYEKVQPASMEGHYHGHKCLMKTITTLFGSLWTAS